MSRLDSDDENKSDGQLRREREARFAKERQEKFDDESSYGSELSKTSSEFKREEAILKLKAKQKELETKEKVRLKK